MKINTKKRNEAKTRQDNPFWQSDPRQIFELMNSPEKGKRNI